MTHRSFHILFTASNFSLYIFIQEDERRPSVGIYVTKSSVVDERNSENDLSSVGTVW